MKKIQKILGGISAVVLLGVGSAMAETPAVLTDLQTDVLAYIAWGVAAIAAVQGAGFVIKAIQWGGRRLGQFLNRA